MKFATKIGLVVVLLAAGCSRYERATYIPSEGAYWVDPPLQQATDQLEATLAKRFETAYPVLETEVCSPGKAQPLAARLEGMCELSAPCLSHVAQLSAQYTARSFTLPPDQKLKLLELQAESLRHAESVLPPGLTDDEMEAVLVASCADSPTPALAGAEPLASYLGERDGDALCRLDWTYTDRAISMLRTALLDAQSDPACGKDIATR